MDVLAPLFFLPMYFTVKDISDDPLNIVLDFESDLFVSKHSDIHITILDIIESFRSDAIGSRQGKSDIVFRIDMAIQERIHRAYDSGCLSDGFSFPGWIPLVDLIKGKR